MEAVDKSVGEEGSRSGPPSAMNHALSGMAIRDQNDRDPFHNIDDVRTSPACNRLQRVRSLCLCSHSPCQRRLDRIVDIERIDHLMDLLALRLDILQVRYRILIQDLIDATVAERCLQPAAKSPQSLGPASSAISLYLLERTLQAVDRESHRVGKRLIEQKKLKDPVWRQVRGVDLAIRFKRGRRTQQSHPFQILIALDNLLRMRPQIFVVCLQQQRRRVGAFDVSAYLNELPAFAVVHG